MDYRFSTLKQALASPNEKSERVVKFHYAADTGDYFVFPGGFKRIFARRVDLQKFVSKTGGRRVYIAARRFLYSEKIFDGV